MYDYIVEIHSEETRYVLVTANTEADAIEAAAESDFDAILYYERDITAQYIVSFDQVPISSGYGYSTPIVKRVMMEGLESTEIGPNDYTRMCRFVNSNYIVEAYEAFKQDEETKEKYEQLGSKKGLE